MKDIIIYKDFIGSVHFNTEDEIFYGKIIGINDLVTFESDSVSELKKAFHEAVDDYLDLCRKHKKEILKSYKGSFNIRTTPNIHRMAVAFATKEHISLNKFVQNAIQHEIEKLSNKE